MLLCNDTGQLYGFETEISDHIILGRDKGSRVECKDNLLLGADDGYFYEIKIGLSDGMLLSHDVVSVDGIDWNGI